MAVPLHMAKKMIIGHAYYIFTDESKYFQSPVQ
jgi:hypothetical protein